MEKIVEPTPLQREFSALFPSLILASSSPNRKKLLEIGGSKVSVFVPETEEVNAGSDYIALMENNAKAKMEAYISSPSFSSLFFIHSSYFSSKAFSFSCFLFITYLIFSGTE